MLKTKVKLTKIKLAGFKSFVDPTSINFQANIAAILGPNGCGKSNIIDAVQWAMGESSAKQLRGETMSDVIFNGSSDRKPLGQASVELFFDNSDSSIGGEYSKYNEISIRREIGRDGTSNYFLNNSICRRKDITDIFLGTGLGINSYAIIEQGTISQFVEAKFEDLKNRLEDVAGISKYKERKRETESRIKHTRENLDRLNDIIEEIDKQIRHLKNQANKAERYKNLKQEERFLKAEFHTLLWRNLLLELEQTNHVLKNKELQLERHVVGQQTLEAKISQYREQEIEYSDKFNEIQERYYRFGSEITNLEQQIRHVKERNSQLEQDLLKNRESLQETLFHKNSDSLEITKLQEEKEGLESQINDYKIELDNEKQKELLAEQQLAELRQTWDRFNSDNAEVNQSIEVEQMRLEHLEHLIESENSQIERIKAERAAFNFDVLSVEISSLQSKLADVRSNSDVFNEELEHKQQQISQFREQNDQLSATLADARNEIQSFLGKRASLEALQKAALGDNNIDLHEWLIRHQLNEKPRLLQEIKVENGWETAVETVLNSYLEAVCLEGFENVNFLMENLPRGDLILFDISKVNDLIQNFNKFPTLISKIDSNLPIINLLNGIYVAETIEEALHLRSSLEAQESIITKEGVWLGSSWLKIESDDHHKTGVLQREVELRELKKIIPQKETEVQQIEKSLQNAQSNLAELEQQYHKLQEVLRDVTNTLGSLNGEVNAKQKHLDYLQAREIQLAQEMQSHESSLSEANEKLLLARKTLDVQQKKQQIQSQERQILVDKREQFQNAVDNAKELLTDKRNILDSTKMRLELINNQLLYLSQSIDRSEKHIANIQQMEQNITQEIEKILAPLEVYQRDLDATLEKRLSIESELQIAKQQLGDIDHYLREVENERTAMQNELSQLRNGIEEIKLKAKELQIRGLNHQEKVAELGFDVKTVAVDDAQIKDIVEWENKLAAISTKIDNLGAINLAAIDEYAEQLKRKEYLDNQNQDLVKALEILENAIQKIDQDTKVRFKETFDRVNNKFQAIFPKIFNGGKAYLELTDEDILKAGVIILAQPPGKRNSTIHLLSGGEKALTAISLIFAIFQLNPAPFCMLDEVDAPLDDSNVLRFCNLVKEISSTIQLIFVSHNKLTLEMADQLTGVTMQEPGVSRVVSVNVEQALKMVDKNQ